jgi:hypothetical protein
MSPAVTAAVDDLTARGLVEQAAAVKAAPQPLERLLVSWTAGVQDDVDPVRAGQGAAKLLAYTARMWPDPDRWTGRGIAARLDKVDDSERTWRRFVTAGTVPVEVDDTAVLAALGLGPAARPPGPLPASEPAEGASAPEPVSEAPERPVGRSHGPARRSWRDNPALAGLARGPAAKYARPDHRTGSGPAGDVGGSVEPDDKFHPHPGGP